MAERALDCFVASLRDGQREISEAVRRLVRSVGARGEGGLQVGPARLRVGRALRLPQAFRSHVKFGFWRGVEVDAE